MIASSWCLFRIDFARTLTSSILHINKSAPTLQSCSFRCGVSPKFRGEAVDVLGRSMERNKRNKVSRWRQVSSQVSSSQHEIRQQDIIINSENLQVVADEERNEAGSQGEEMCDGFSSHISAFQHQTTVIVKEDEELSFQSVENITEVGAQISFGGKCVTSIADTCLPVKHSSSIQVSSSLIRFIKGKEGATQKKVEEETGVQIKLPTSRKEDSIIIEGDSPESVSKATERIRVIIDEAVKSPSLEYSHFISLPLALHPELVKTLYQFQNSILGFSETDQVKIPASGNEATENTVQPKIEVGTDKIKVDMQNIPLVSYPPKISTRSASESKSHEASALGIDRSIFIKPKTFHLTVLMLKLWNKELVKAAAEVLQNISSKVIEVLDSRPVSIRLKGLECMKGSFSKARVLYAPVEEIGGEERLMRACQVIIDAFVEAGLVHERDAKHKLKLHATVMNVLHRKSKGRKKYNDYFDARMIADRYGSEDWGEYLIQEAHLSQRFAYDENGYYRCCASIPFPESLRLD